MDGLYPELENYIYEYCSKFRTVNEALAAKTLIYNPYSESMRAMMAKHGWLSDDPVVLQMIADGYEAFKGRTVRRIWADHRHELSLNLCPVCGKIARTPFARQCRFCGYDWH